MKVVSLARMEEYPMPAACGLCLGNLDGVHRGHRALIDELKRQNAALTQKLPLGALLFETPPSAILGRCVPQINTLEEKMELLHEAGLSFVILLDFASVKDMPPDDFVREILIGVCNCRLAVCGFNYSYGARGAGNPERLAATFNGDGRHLAVVPPVMHGNEPVSSTVIRSLLNEGRPEDAAALLGRPFFFTGKVESGKQVGRVMGYPTANLTFPQNGLVPAHGVYTSLVRVGRRTYTAVSNVGCRPTFDDGNTVNCENFLFDFHGDLYGKSVRVSLLRFLREERKFETVQELEQQIAADVQRAVAYHWE